ncbi:sulfurtransferase TusA family protein [Moraxella sp. Tifton1]|uniref:sulfurtransferase TusA family protein n=1 Tax=Moraxella oculi TaxID=2940516 RepID=UPI00201398D7|nr:sulfurtransferase TusA family protein [Moraxella sp. Tifton1]MCL1623140.1 sulfurtransferase TusA family protein [Moraxella sp. Tifton1]
MSNLTISPKLTNQLSGTELSFIQSHLHECKIDGVLCAYLDARTLPCPMPLLKAKIALRTMNDGESLYLIASDKNSQTDLVAFCQKQGHGITDWRSDVKTNNTENYFHFIITKNTGV